MLDTKIKAPDFTKGLPWINVTQPLTLEELKGKLVLLDFWTFCCSDCMHILPYLRTLEEKYADYLVVVGVHSAKFDNEGSEENIKRAVARYGIEHPVVCDRGFSLWEKYYVREWPTLVLIDAEGYIVERVACSQQPYGKFDIPIQLLIEEHKDRGELRAGKLPQIAVHAEAEAKTLRFPGKVTLADDGKVIISDSGHNRIVICEQDGTVVDTIGSGAAGTDDGSFDSCSFRGPQGTVLDGRKLYIADTDNHMLRLAHLDERRVETLAGTGKQRGFEHFAPILAPKNTALSSPWDLALRGSELLIAMAGSHQIWCFNIAKNSIEVYAGSGKESLKDGARLEAQLSQTSGLSIHGDRLYFADSETSSIRSLSFASGDVKTLVGEGLFAFGDEDGAWNLARLQHPLGVGGYKDDLLIADSYNHKIKMLKFSDKTVQSISGTGKPGNACGASPQYSEPGGIAVWKDCAFIADTNNHEIKKLNLLDRTCELFDVKEKTSAIPHLPNCTEIKSPVIVSGPAIKGELQVSLPPQFHLNEEMPPSVQLVCASKSLTLQSVKTVKDKITLDIKQDVSKLNGKPCPSQLAITLYYCADTAGSACFVKSFLYKLSCDSSGVDKFSLELNCNS